MATSTLKRVEKYHLTMCPEGDRKGILENAPHDYLMDTASILEDKNERDTVFPLHEFMVKGKGQMKRLTKGQW